MVDFAANEKYRNETNPSLLNAFSAAAWRWGHSALAEYFAIMEDDGSKRKVDVMSSCLIF